jgi:hypothetical protein
MVEKAAGVMEDFAHVDASLDKLCVRPVYIGHNEMESLHRTRFFSRDALAEENRALRAWGREMDNSKLLVFRDIDVEPPT